MASGRTASDTCHTDPQAHAPRPPRRTRRRRHRPHLAILSAVTLTLAAALPASAQTSTPEVLETDQAATLTTAGVAQMVPRDGRLAGYGFEVAVTGVAFTDQAGAPQSQSVQPAPGDELAVVSVSETDPDTTIQTSTLAYDTNTPPAFSMQVGQQTVSLPAFPFGSGNVVWAVAIPKGSPATLVATLDNFSQSFDLRRGARTDPAPLALYRDPTKPFVTENLSATTQLTGTGSLADPVTVPVEPVSAELEYFQPNLDSLQPVPAPDQAWLVIDMNDGDAHNVASDAAGHLIEFNETLGGNSVVLQTPSGTIESTSVDQADSQGGLFPPYYAFQVPATFTSGTVVIKAAGTIPAGDQTSENLAASPTPVTLTFTQNPSIAINLPPVPPSAPPGYLTSAPKTQHAAGTHTVRRTHNTGGSFPFWVVILAAIVILGVAGPLIRRRRGTLRVLPVTRAARALLAGTSVALMPAHAQPPVTEPLALGPSPTPPDEDAAGGVLVEEAPPAAAATAAPIAAPATHDLAEGVALVVSVLGRLQVQGLRRPVRRKDVTRVLAALAIEDPPVTVQQLRDLCAVDPDKPPSSETIHSLVSMLRGSLPEGLLPTIREGDIGYQWAGSVDVDWSVFRTLAERATATTGTEKVDLGLKALSLIRGRPLDHGSWESILPALRRIETTIENLAADTARAAVSARDARSAEAAVAKGMLAIPDSLVLWDSRLVAAAAGSGFGLERAWSEANKTLGGDANQLEPLYRRLQAGDW